MAAKDFAAQGWGKIRAWLVVVDIAPAGIEMIQVPVTLAEGVVDVMMSASQPASTTSCSLSFSFHTRLQVQLYTIPCGHGLGDGS